MFARLTGKGNVLTAVVIIGVAAVVGSILIRDTLDRGRQEVEQFRATAVDQHQAGLRNLVDVAYGVMASRHLAWDQAGQGAPGLAQHQAQVLELLRELRYGKDHYFWINDLQVRMLMHPFMPELEGRDLSDFQDPDGIRLFAEFVRVCREQGQGFVAYSWPRPGQSAPQPKLSHVRLFEPWGWIIGTGTYIDDVEAEVAVREQRVREAVSAQILQIFGLTAAACLLVSMFAATAERKRHVSAAVVASEQRLRSIVTGAPDGIVIFDVETGRIALANPAVASLLGRPQEQLMGAPVTRRALESVRAADAAGLTQIAFTDHLLDRPDGSRVNVESTGTFTQFQGRRSAIAFLRDVTLRRQAEAEVRRHQELLTSIIDNAHDGILVLDAEHRVTYYNQEFVDSWGISVEVLDTHPTIEELLRRVCAAGLYAEGHADLLVARRLEQLAGSGPQRRIETPRRDGVIMEAYATPLPTGGHLLTYRDVTEDQRAAQALRDQTEFSESLVRSSAVATFVLDPDHRVLFWNRACQQLTGKAAAAMVGTRDHWKAFYKEQRPCLADLVIDGDTEHGARYYGVFGASTLTADALHAEGWYPNLGGCDRYLVFDAAPIRNRRGELVAVVETLQDLADLKRAEEARSLLAAAVEQAAEAIVVTDTQGCIEYINPAFTAITGYAEQEVLGRYPSLLRSGVHDREFYRTLERTLRAGEVWKGELVNRTKDGNLYQEESTISPVRDAAGRISHYVSVHRDVTAEREVQRRAAQGQRLESLGTLAGGIAHDFNNILAGIMGFTELSLDNVPADGPLHANLTRILRGTERARDLVAQILTFSHTGAADSEAARPVALAPLIEETIEFLRASLPPAVALHWHTDGAPNRVLGSPSRVYQVLLNLCTNAAQAMGAEGGTLEVTVTETVGSGSPLPVGSTVCLRVEDTGPGIAPEILDRIFEPFFTTKPVGQGTGMGLAVAHGIVRAMGGEVRVWSELGAGTRFDVYFPAAENATVERPQLVTTPLTTGQGRVLVVDDEDHVAELERQILEQLGYVVVTAADGEEGLQQFQADPDGFDIVVTDHSMPGISGLDMIAKMRELRPDLPVVLCTGDCHSVDPDLAGRLGVCAILQKPMSRGQFVDAVAAALTPHDLVLRSTPGAGATASAPT